jgi:hypothetical protein
MEGPSLLILKEAMQPFVGQYVSEVSGNTKQAKGLKNTRVTFLPAAAIWS